MAPVRPATAGTPDASVTATPPVRPKAEELRLLVEALALPRVGPVTFRRALDAAGSYDGAAVLLRRQVRPRLPDHDRVRVEGRVRRVLEAIEAEAVHVLLRGRPGYPERLLDLESPPDVVFARGRLELADERVVAVVGTRSCSRYGREVAERLGRVLAAAGVVVVSGLARGVDAAAHGGAGPARTIGVLGCGVDVLYPPSSARLQRAIGREGLLLSELLPGTPPMAHHFPWRNRMIAALAEAVVVVEAPEKSGALRTADYAGPMGRYVFAVPGPVTARTSRGSNRLILDGAGMITGPEEVLATLDIPLPDSGAVEARTPPDLTGTSLAIWRVLERGPLHADEVAAALGLEARHGLASLLSLEVMGHARQLPGLRFTRA